MEENRGNEGISTNQTKRSEMINNVKSQISLFDNLFVITDAFMPRSLI